MARILSTRLPGSLIRVQRLIAVLIPLVPAVCSAEESAADRWLERQLQQ